MLATAALPFPAVVTSPDGDHWPVARCRVTDGQVEVFSYERGAVRLVARFTVREDEATRRNGEPLTIRFTDTEDEAWFVMAGPGCGCGHPLKRAQTSALDKAAAAGIWTE